MGPLLYLLAMFLHHAMSQGQPQQGGTGAPQAAAGQFPSPGTGPAASPGQNPVLQGYHGMGQGGFGQKGPMGGLQALLNAGGALQHQQPFYTPRGTPPANGISNQPR